MPDNTMEGAERWAAEIAGPAYAIDDETAIKVIDGVVEIVSEGKLEALSRRALRGQPRLSEPSAAERAIRG